MSMLPAQCDELRAMAESVGMAMPQAATLMMEAADTIWELRGSVHRERSEADRLRASNEVISEDHAALCEQNAKLREEIEAAKHDLSLFSCELVASKLENAKLRELCRRFAEYVSHDRCEGCVCKRRCNDGEIEECWQRTEIREIAHKLGIEVDE